MHSGKSANCRRAMSSIGNACYLSKTPEIRSVDCAFPPRLHGARLPACAVLVHCSCSTWLDQHCHGIIWADHLHRSGCHICRCATPFGIDVVGITEAIALIGALVGGLVARQRKKEAERLNEQLRKINMQLRQQARAGTVYAPGLSYAPVGRQIMTTATIPLTTVDTQQTTQTASSSVKAFSSTDEELSPEQESCRKVMREGKKLLRSNQGAPTHSQPSTRHETWQCVRPRHLTAGALGFISCLELSSQL